MNRNLKIAKELVKTARDLVANDSVVVDEVRMVVGCGDMRTAAGDRMTVYDNESKLRLEQEKAYERQMRNNKKSVHELFLQALSSSESRLKNAKPHNGRIVISGIGTSEGYIEDFSRYGKVSILVEFYAGSHGKDIGVFFNTQIKSTANEKIVTIERRFVPVDFSVNGDSDVDVEGDSFVSGNDEILENIPGVVIDFIDDNKERLSNMIDEKLYEMNTVWWKRLFNLDRY